MPKKFQDHILVELVVRRVNLHSSMCNPRFPSKCEESLEVFSAPILMSAVVALILSRLLMTFPYATSYYIYIGGFRRKSQTDS
jgi:hypothetical protein